MNIIMLYQIILWTARAAKTVARVGS